MMTRTGYYRVLGAIGGALGGEPLAAGGWTGRKWPRL